MQELKNWKENFESISRSGPASQFDHAFNPSIILNVELRELLAIPRKMPRPLREEIAGILIYELFSDGEYEIKDEKLFMGKFGVFFPIFLSLRSLKSWNEIKTLARTNSMAGVFIIRTLLEEIFSLLDVYENELRSPKKFSQNLEKILRVLGKLINDTYVTWEKKERREKEMNSPRWYESPDTWGKQQNGENEQEYKRENNQENKPENDREKKGSYKDKFLNSPENENRENLCQQTETMTGSERLASMTREFMFSEKAGEALDITLGDKMAAKIDDLIPVLEEHLEMLEILSMLFPGRMWDHSLRALHKEYFGNLDYYAAVLRKRADLREIIDQVGRIELEYGSKKLGLSPYSRNEVHSITFSSDIQTLLPIEVVKLKNPILKLKFYADMLEGKLLTYQLRGENWNSDTIGKRRKGPVIALVDTSASMRGAREFFAKAVMLAITRRMLKEGRDVKVILFSSKWQTFEIELTNKKRMGQEFLEFLKYTFGGGTDFNSALRTGLKALKGEKAFEGADVLFLTDGESEFSEAPLIREWNEIKAERKARIFSLIIGNYDAGGLEKVSDHTYIVGNAEDWEVRESPSSFIKAISRPLRF
ncbi:MAG: hypothetical protein QG646_996 [Euryarchaeota archaeon]|nr:hypothetical protein [Euryarchaeota archaeon]